MANPFQQIIISDPVLNRVQANVSKAFNSLTGSLNPSTPTVLRANTYALKASDQFLMIPAASIPNSSNGILIQLLDATKNPGFSFSFKRTDTSTSNIIFSAANFTTQTGQPQTIEGGTSFVDAASLGFGTLLSDGSNWWII